MIRRLTGLLMAAALLLGLAVPPARAEGAELTLMVYMCGSNLESQYSAATMDLLEMASSGYDMKKVNLLVMTGGTQSWELGLPTDALCVYMPMRGSLRMVDAFESMSMGAPEALNALLAYGYERFPAEKYALIMWDHGGGPLNGVCWDELYESDHLTMEELTSALASSPVASQPLEWIGFDACLMASAEVASLLEPYARYMIASEETEPGEGWDYAFLTDIDGDADGAATGRRIIDGYFDASGSSPRLTLSCMDLSKVGALREAMDGFFEKLEISGGNYSMYSYVARNTRGFGKGAARGSSYDLIDLGSLVDQLSEQPSANAAAAESARKALDDIIVYSRCGDDAGSGLSIYHPFDNMESYASTWSALYPQLGFSKGYADYVARFAGFLFGTAKVAWDSLTALPTSEQGVLALPLSNEQQEMLSSAMLNVLRWDAESRAYARLCAVNRVTLEDGVLYAAIPERFLAAVDETGNALVEAVPFEPMEDGTVAVYVNYCAADAVDSAEASALVAVNTLGRSKDFGSYSFEDNSGGSQSGGGVLSQGSQSSVGSEVQGVVSADSQALSEILAADKPQVSSVSPMNLYDFGEVVTVPQTVSFDIGAAPVSATASGGTLLMPSGQNTVQIVPAEVNTTQMENGVGGHAGSVSSLIPLDSFATIDVGTFTPEQVVVDLSAYEGGEGEKPEQADVVHAWLRCEVGEDGGLTVLETWCYSPENDIWSTRGALDTASYPVLAFPMSWRLPTTTDESLTGFDAWEEAFTSSATAPSEGWQLRFVPAGGDGEDLCASFQITDSQNRTHGSVPLRLNGK